MPVLHYHVAAPSPWIAYYESLPGGQCRITEDNLSALQAAHPERLLFADIAGKNSHVLLLDFPFRVAEPYVSFKAYYLRRIAVIELPGWGHALSGVGATSPLREYKVKSARFVA